MIVSPYYVAVVIIITIDRGTDTFNKQAFFTAVSLLTSRLHKMIFKQK